MSEFFDDREIGDTKGKANRSTSRREEDTSSRYAFLYYSVRPDTSRWRKGKFTCQRAYIENTMQYFLETTDLRRLGPPSTKINGVYGIEVAVRYSKETARLFRNSAEKWERYNCI